MHAKRGAIIYFTHVIPPLACSLKAATSTPRLNPPNRSPLIWQPILVSFFGRVITEAPTTEELYSDNLLLEAAEGNIFGAQHFVSGCGQNACCFITIFHKFLVLFSEIETTP